jgi:hypothetical protein
MAVSRRQGLLLGLMSLLIVAFPLATRAQKAPARRIALLRLDPDSANLEVSTRFEERLRASIRLHPQFNLADATAVNAALAGRTPLQVARSQQLLSTVIEGSAIDYVILYYIGRDDGSRIVFRSVLYGRMEDEYLHEARREYDSESEALADIDRMTAGLLKVNNFTPPDTTFWLSMLAPGLGQLHAGESLHAGLAIGLVAAVLGYWVTSPKPDGFTINWSKYTTQIDSPNNTLRYFVGTVEVSKSEFFAERDADLVHYYQAAGERRAAKVRLRRASLYLVSAYAFNLLDAYLLTKKRTPDLGDFLISIQPRIQDPRTAGDLSFGLQLRIYFP